jgi:hypothetical protein
MHLCSAAKGMLADLKEAAEKRRQERSTVLQAVSGRADFLARLQVGRRRGFCPAAPLAEEVQMVQNRPAGLAGIGWFGAGEAMVDASHSLAPNSAQSCAFILPRFLRSPT